MAEPVLRVTDLVKRFGEFTAVGGVSFDIAPGEILGLLGANGAGKTTAINMVLGLITPTSGRIEVFGRDLAQHRTAILRQMNFCSTYTNLPGNLLVWQNLTVFGKLYAVPDLPRRIDEVLALLEIGHLKKRVAGHLSAGESTRLNLCKALLNRPRLLLLDEPTASLDPDIADKVRKAVRRVCDEDGVTMLYTSHNMRDVEEVCDRVVFMHKGTVLHQGTPEEIVAHFQEKTLEDVFIRVARGGDLEPQSAVRP
jgi:ABC-2 type transport system ATP-binding protein